MSFAALTHKTDLQIATTTLIKRIHFESTKTLWQKICLKKYSLYLC